DVDPPLLILRVFRRSALGDFEHRGARPKALMEMSPHPNNGLAKCVSYRVLAKRKQISQLAHWNIRQCHSPWAINVYRPHGISPLLYIGRQQHIQSVLHMLEGDI